jgi:hypothetical protein
MLFSKLIGNKRKRFLEPGLDDLVLASRFSISCNSLKAFYAFQRPSSILEQTCRSLHDEFYIDFNKIENISNIKYYNPSEVIAKSLQLLQKSKKT